MILLDVVNFYLYKTHQKFIFVESSSNGFVFMQALAPSKEIFSFPVTSNVYI